MESSTVAATPEPDTAREREVEPSRRAARARRAVPFLLFFVLAAGLVGWHMHKYPWLSPIDENVQFDYIRILPHVPNGEAMSQDSLRMTACRHYAPDLFDQGLAHFKWPSCRSKHFDPAAFPAGGPSSAGSTAPFYYMVTAVLTRPIAYVVDVPLILLVRSAGVLWLGSLMSVGYLIARRLRVPVGPAAAAAVFVGSSSDVVTSAATAGPDVATAVTGGLVVLAALAWRPARRPTLLLLLAAVVASVTKLTDFTAVGVAMTVLLGKAFVARRDGKRTWVPPLAATGAVAIVFVALSGAWFYRPTPEPVALSGAPPAPTAAVVVPWDGLQSTLLFNFFPPNVGNFNASFLEGIFNARLEQLMAGLMVFGVLAVVLAGGRTGVARGLGVGVLLMAVLGPVVLTVLNQYAYNQFFILPSRYGYGLLAPLIATTAWPLRRGAAARALMLLGGVSYLSVFF